MCLVAVLVISFLKALWFPGFFISSAIFCTSLLNLTVLANEVCESPNESCQESTADCPFRSHHSSGKNVRWDHYLNKIQNALAAYVPCELNNCSCYMNVIDDDLRPWVSKGITKEDIESAKSKGTHYQIINHKVYREKSCLFPFRCSGVEYFITKLASKLPDLEFILNTHDWPQASKHGRPYPVLSFSKTHQYWDIMYPAWTFWEGGPAISLYPTGLGRWDVQRMLINKTIEMWPWEKKKNIAFFRGSRTSAERDPLVILSRKYPHLVDAQYTKNQAWKSEKDTLGEPPAQEIPLEDHCLYKYLFNFRGVAASFRLKHLFLCRSLVFHVGDEWKEFFYFTLKPWVHYIPVSKDLIEVRELLTFVQENDSEMEKIALRGFHFIWKHLKMEDVFCYWEQLLLRYKNLLKYKPSRNNNLEPVLKKNIGK